MSHYVNSYYSTDMDKFYAVYLSVINNSGKTNMRDPAWLASHTQYGRLAAWRAGGVQNDPPKIRIGVQVLNYISINRCCAVRQYGRLS